MHAQALGVDASKLMLAEVHLVLCKNCSFKFHVLSRQVALRFLNIKDQSGVERN